MSTLAVALALALSIGSAAPASQGSLVDVPARWRGEHIALPPGFAPAIEWKGVEDLAFAPGMFRLGEPDWFSYAMALRIDGDVELDAAELERFLVEYYRGLYVVVAEGKGFANDPSKTTARVTSGPSGLRASVSTFDAFTDGRPVELAIDMEVHRGPRATELLALISPAPPGAPIREELATIASKWRADRPPELFLNHVYLVVDRATYDALVKSDFLRDELAVAEERTTRRADVAYAGFYLYGRETYLEILPDGAAGMTAGAHGIVLGVDRAGGLDRFEERLKARGVESFPASRTRELDGAEVPWFRMLGVAMPSKGLDVLAMEYDARFLARWHADLAPKEPGVRRVDALERYAAAAKRGSLRTSQLLGDVRGVVVAADEPRRARLAAIGAAAKYETVESAATGSEPRVVALDGPRFRVELAPASAAPDVDGLTRVDLRLTRPVERAPLRFGRLELAFDGTRATLTVSR